MIEIYILVGITVLIAGLIAYAKIQYAMRQSAEAKTQLATNRADQVDAAITQVDTTSAAVRKVQEERKAKQEVEQAQIDAHAPRSHFENSDF